VLASVLSYIAGPLIPVILPIFNRLAHLRKNDLLEHDLQISVQLMAALIFPVMTLIFFFSYPIIKIWSHQAVIATNSSHLLSILILGSAVNAFTNIYWQLDLASGKTKMWVISNFIFLIVLIPLLVLMIQKYELLGAAYIYLAYHLLNFLIIVPSVILRSFNLKVLRHTFQDLLISFVLTGIIVLAFNHYFSAKLNSDLQYLGYFVLVLSVTIALNSLFLPKLRLWAQSELTHLLKN
jgi:O-antigen/teichoic acid export membrane protein